MKFEKYFPYFIALDLLTLAAIFRSAALGYASVSVVALILAKDVFEKIAVAKSAPIVTIPDEVKRNIQDMNARILTIEHGIRTRGF